jgi:hypothetical protein
MVGPPLDDCHINPRQRQLSRQHHSCRTASGDHHCMIGHAHPPFFRWFQVGPEILHTDRALAASDVGELR